MEFAVEYNLDGISRPTTTTLVVKINPNATPSNIVSNDTMYFLDHGQQESVVRQCAGILRPGGVLSLAVPDRRYCFDRFRERTSLGRVIDVLQANRVVHSEGSVVESHLNAVAKGGSISWDATKVGAFRPVHTPEEGRKRAAMAAGGEYVDVHNWVFTPNHLRLLLVDLQALGFIGLRELAYHETVGSEFYIALSRDGQGPGLPRDALLRLSALELHSTERIVFET